MKTIKKPVLGHIKKSGIGEQNLPRFLREIRLDSKAGKKYSEKKDSTSVDTSYNVGTNITVDKVFQVGDTVAVMGVSKGKGFAGVVKRHHFRGGPRTHGQSDRERAPGAIGQTTTPGRVYKGKRMAGRMGKDRVTVENLRVLSVNSENNLLVVKGLIPGPIGSLVTIMKQ